MKLHDPFTPQLRKNLWGAAAEVMFCAAAAGMWIFRERLYIKTGELLIITGAAVLVITVNICTYKRKRENYRVSKELCEKQKDVGTDKGNGIFY